MSYDNNYPWREINEKNIEDFANQTKEEFLERRQVGIKKYGTNFVGDPILHQREEILDALFYNWASSEERKYLLQKIERLEDAILYSWNIYTEKDKQKVKEILLQKKGVNNG